MESPTRIRRSGKARLVTVFLLMFFLLMLLIGGYLATQFRATPIQVSTETTYLTEPLDEDGLPNYIQHLHQQLMSGATAANNGAVPFWQAVGSQYIPPDQQTWFFEQLGMSIPEPRDPPFDIYDAAKKHPDAAAELPEDGYAAVVQRLNNPWRKSDMPELAEWLEQHADEFELLQQAASRERFACPSPSAGHQCSVVELTLPHLTALRVMVRNLSGRAMLRIGEGEMDAAWRDCQTILELGSKLETQSLVGWLVKLSILEMALRPMSALVELDRDEERIRNIEDFVAKLPPFDDVRRTIDQFERLMYLSAVVDMSRNRFKVDQLTGDQVTPSKALDWNQILRRGNEAYDALVQALEGDRRQQVEKLKEWEAAYVIRVNEIGFFEKAKRSATRQGRTRTCSDILIATLMPATIRTADAHRDLSIQLQQFRLRALLNAYRCEHKQFPESLEALGADPALLVDPFNNAPFVYERTENGFLLYSVGFNGKDEQACNGMRLLYRGVEFNDNVNELVLLLSEPELVELEEKLSVGRTEWTAFQIRMFVDGDDVSTRSPIVVPRSED